MDLIFIIIFPESIHLAHKTTIFKIITSPLRQSVRSACTILLPRNQFKVGTAALVRHQLQQQQQPKSFPSILSCHLTTSNSKSSPVQQVDQHNTEMKCEFKRLPTNVVPKHYNLELTPCLKSFKFDGKTSVLFEVSKDNTFH